MYKNRLIFIFRSTNNTKPNFDEACVFIFFLKHCLAVHQSRRIPNPKESTEHVYLWYFKIYFPQNIKL